MVDSTLALILAEESIVQAESLEELSVFNICDREVYSQLESVGTWRKGYCTVLAPFINKNTYDYDLVQLESLEEAITYSRTHGTQAFALLDCLSLAYYESFTIQEIEAYAEYLNT